MIYVKNMIYVKKKKRVFFENIQMNILLFVYHITYNIFVYHIT